MVNQRNKLYHLLLGACMGGYAWLAYTFSSHSHGFGVCLFKRFTHLPCPSCGVTRSIWCLLRGEPLQAWFTNPFGFLVAYIMMTAPLWIGYDLLTNSDGLFRFYRRMELRLKKPTLFLPLILLILMNWAWNIGKGI